MTTQVFGERLGPGALVGTAQVMANKRRAEGVAVLEECSAVGRQRRWSRSVSAPSVKPARTAVCRSERPICACWPTSFRLSASHDDSTASSARPAGSIQVLVHARRDSTARPVLRVCERELWRPDIRNAASAGPQQGHAGGLRASLRRGKDGGHSQFRLTRV